MKIITVTLSPAIDIHCSTDSFTAERENFAKITSRDAGGKGINISRALLACGIKNTALVAVGDKNADGLLASLSSDGLDCEAIWTQGLIRENITVHTIGAKETRLSFDGFCGDSALLEEVEQYLCENIKKGDIVALAGSIPSGVDIESVKAVVLRLKSLGADVIVDSRSFKPSDIIECKPFLIKPNEEEIIAYIGAEIASVEDAAKAAISIYKKGVENVMISLGAHGAVLACADGIYFANAPTIEAISTIGAGDSSIAGFIAAYKDKKAACECLKTAVAYGSAACLTEGTKPPRKEDIDNFIAEIEIKSLLQFIP